MCAKTLFRLVADLTYGCADESRWARWGSGLSVKLRIEYAEQRGSMPSVRVHM